MAGVVVVLHKMAITFYFSTEQLLQCPVSLIIHLLRLDNCESQIEIAPVPKPGGEAGIL